MRRIVVTGLGPVTPIGIGKDAFLQGLLEGASGVGRLTRFDAAGYGSRVAGEIHDFDPLRWMPEEDRLRTDRGMWLAKAGVGLAISDAGLEESDIRERGCGLAFGNAVGGAEFAEREVRRALERGLASTSSHLYSGDAPCTILNFLRDWFGLTGPCLLLSTGCTAGTDAIGEAARKIRQGAAEIMIAGGSDAPLTRTLHASFDVIGALSRHNEEPACASRPFDGERDGFVMAEGAGVVVLESLEHALARGCPQIYCEVSGFAATSNAHHMTAPAPDPVENARAMTMALHRAGVEAGDIDYVNAHGSSTPLNDKTETTLFKRVLGSRAWEVPVSSTKSQTGHGLGAAGGIEAIACALAMRHGFVPPTINLSNSDPECDLDYVPNRARNHQVDVAVSNACAFGGLNSVLVLTGGPAR